MNNETRLLSEIFVQLNGLLTSKWSEADVMLLRTELKALTKNGTRTSLLLEGILIAKNLIEIYRRDGRTYQLTTEVKQT